MLQESNRKLIDIIKADKPFIISRLGMGPETVGISIYLKNRKIIGKNFENAGIYCSKIPDLEKFYILSKECLKNSEYLADFQYKKGYERNFIKEKLKLKELNSRVLEPFYMVLEEQEPWSLHLYGKKVLIINPFVDSFQKQLQNGFKIFKDKDIFHPKQEFIFYRSYQTSAGNHLHSSWVETFSIMKEDIRKLDFDIALLGCGGYGLPLCNFIKTELGKSAIYIGGGLQLLFGVKGRRWNNHSIIGKLIEENGKFITPFGDEVMKNNHKIEGGCYW